MQKANDPDVASGLCREEYQWWIRYWLHPLLEKAVQDRLDAEEGSGDLYECDGRRVTFRQLVEHWLAELKAAYLGLTKGDWKSWNWQFKVPTDCYKPTDLPYFYSLDNASAHSFWMRYPVKHLPRDEMGTSLLQGIRICPHGHDIHQIVEHSIGCIKRHVKNVIAKAAKQGRLLDTDELFREVHVGADEFGSSAWERNRRRLMHALEIISRDKNELYAFEYKKVRYCARGTAGGYAPMFLS